MVVARINGHLGHYSLQWLTPLQIEKFYADLLATGSYKGDELAPKNRAQHARGPPQGALRC